MCGRYALAELPPALTEALGLEAPRVKPRYNIAPAQTVVAALSDPEAGGRGFHDLTWGLVPFWAKDKGMAARMFNARAETAREKPAFRAAFRHRRCLVPASGFYEWRRGGKAKTPFYFSPAAESAPLALAGLWEDWTDGTEHIRSLAILTTNANAAMRPVHDRMPVIIPPSAWEKWIDPAVQHPGDLEALLAPCDDSFLSAREVGTYVNDARHEGEECVRPA